MPRNDVDLNIGANISALRKRLEEAEDLTAAQAKQMTIALERELQETKKAHRKAAKEMAKAHRRGSRQAEREWTGRLGDIETAANTVFGETVGDILDVGRGLGALGPAGMVAVGGIAAAGVATTALLGGLTAAVLKADDLHRELKAFQGVEGFEAMPPEELDRIEKANDALAAMGTIGKQLIVELGAEFAPVLEAVSFQAVKFGLMGLDAADKWLESKSILREIAVWFADSFVQSLLSPVTGIMSLVEALGAVGEMLGLQNNVLSRAGEAYDQFTRGIAEAGVDMAIGGAKSALDDLSDSTEDYDARARELLAVQHKQGDAYKKNAEAAKKLREEQEKLFQGDLSRMEKLNDIFDDINSDLDTEETKIRRNAAARANALADMEAAVQSELEAVEKGSARQAELQLMLEDIALARIENETREERDLAAVRQKTASDVVAAIERIEGVQQKAFASEEQRIEAEAAAKVASVEQQADAILASAMLTAQQRTAIETALAAEVEQIHAAKAAQLEALDQSVLEAFAAGVETYLGGLLEAVGMVQGSIEQLAEASRARFEEAKEAVESQREQYKTMLEEQSEERQALSDHIRGLSAAERTQRIEDLMAEQKAEREAAQAKIAAAKAAAEERRKVAQRAAMTAYVLDKAAAVSGIAIDAAKLGSELAVWLAPALGPGAIPAAIGIAAGMATLQTAAVLSTKPPQVKHTGGFVQAAPTRSPDEVDARLQGGEFVVPTASARGNEQLLEEIRRTGRAPAPSVRVQIGMRTLEPELVELAEGDGAFGALVRDASPSTNPGTLR